MNKKATEAIKKHYEEYRYMTKSELIAFILTQLDRIT